MPFFKGSIRKQHKNASTLQVQIPLIKYGKLVKRALSAAFCSSRKGSLTVEAAMAFPLFLFFMVLLMFPLKWLEQSRRIQTALEAAGEELSQYAYVLYKLQSGEQPELSGTDFSEELGQILTEEGVLLYVRKKVGEQVNFKQFESVSFAHSSVLQDGETIDLIMECKALLPFSVFGLKSIPVSARSFRRAWIGRERERGEGAQAEELVYVGRSRTRYHRVRTCHYLYNDIQQISWEELENSRNSSGKKYKPCDRCGSLALESGSVYILTGGEKYHSDRNCSSLAAYVQAVPLSQVEHLGPCSYCSG